MARRTGTAPEATRVKLFGFLLLLAGWALVLCALALLPSAGPRVAFIVAGMGVEIVGLVIVIHAHAPFRGARD
jgi:NADH:ubiquinone oxidoreductase subunit 4 (subunit M)